MQVVGWLALCDDLIRNVTQGRHVGPLDRGYEPVDHRLLTRLLWLDRSLDSKGDIDTEVGHIDM